MWYNKYLIDLFKIKRKKALLNCQLYAGVDTTNNKHM